MSETTRAAERTECKLIKPPTTDAYGQITEEGQEYDFRCSFTIGSMKKFIDGQGNDFTPSATIWFEQRDEFTPEVGDKLVVVGKEYEIRHVVLDDCSLFNQRNDFMVATK